MTSQSNPRGPQGRRAAVIAAVALQLAYFSFRAATLNVDGLTESLFSFLVLAAELTLGASFTLMLVELWETTRHPAANGTATAAVDVILVVRDEDLTLVRATLAASARLEGAHQTLVLDCLGRFDVRAAAEEADVGYFHPVPRAATRGQALDAALPRLAGQFVAVFDAGAIPETNFLRRTAACFGDDRLAAVQTSIITPAPLIGADAHPRADLTPRYSDPLHRERQAGRNHWNAATLYPSGFLVRRTALDDVGGFGAAECETLRLAIRLHREGWRTEYVDDPLCVDFTSSGAAHAIAVNAEGKADDLRAVVDEGAAFDQRLSLTQRLCYTATLLRAASPLPRAVLYSTPLIVLAFGIVPAAPAWQVWVGVAAIGYHVFAALMRRDLTAGRASVFAQELGAAATVWSGCFAVGSALFGSLIRRRDGGRSAALYAESSAWPHVISIAATAAALYWAWMGPAMGVAELHALVVPTLVALFNAGLMLVAVDRFLSRWERRRHERRPALLSVQYDVPGEANLGGLGLVFDLSEGGLGLIMYHPFNIGQPIFMTLEGPDGRMRLQGEVRSVHRVGVGVTPALNQPAAYKVGMQLTRATAQHRDLLLHWSALQTARDVNRAMQDDAPRRLFEARLVGRPRQRLHVPLLLGGDTDDVAPWGCVTHDLWATGFHVFSPHRREKDAELRFALATPFGTASGWVRVESDAALHDGSSTIRSQRFAFTIWDHGSEPIIKRVIGADRRQPAVKAALSPASPPPRPPFRSYALAACVWFLVAAPLLSLAFLQTRASEILLHRLARTQATPTPAELEELETYSQRIVAAGTAPTSRLEQLYHVLDRGGRRWEATRLAEEIVSRLPSSPEWRLRWGTRLSAAGLHADAERRFQEALRRADSRNLVLASDIHAARGRNYAAAQRWSDAVDAFQEAGSLVPGRTDLQVELMTALRGGAPRNETVTVSRPPSRPAPLPPTPIHPVAHRLTENPKKRTLSPIPTVALRTLNGRLNAYFEDVAGASAFLSAWSDSLVVANDSAWSLAAMLIQADAIANANRLSDAAALYLEAVGAEAFSGAPSSALRERAYIGYFQTAAKLLAKGQPLAEVRQASMHLRDDPHGTLRALSAAADYFERAGDPDEMIALLERAHRLTPQDVPIGRRLAAALEKAGDYDRAAAILKRLLEAAASP